MLITSTLLKQYTDAIAVAYDKMLAQFGDTATADEGTLSHMAARLRAVPVINDDYEMQADLNKSCNDLVSATDIAEASKTLSNAITALNRHCRTRGTSVDATIVSLSTYLAYLNGTPRTVQLQAGFGDAYLNAVGSSLSAIYISPRMLYASATRAVGGSFTAGTAIDTDLYADCSLMVDVIEDFAGGAGAPAVSITGVRADASTATLTHTFTGNNPAAVRSTVDVTAMVSDTSGDSYTRHTVTLSSVTGLLVGCRAILVSGTTEEVVIIESISGSDVTFYADAPVSTSSDIKIPNVGLLTAGSGTNFFESVSGITITISSHSAGTVRVYPKIPRRGYE